MAKTRAYYGPLPDPQSEYLHCTVVGSLIIDEHNRKYLNVMCKQCPKETAEVRIVSYSRAFIEAGGTRCKSCSGRSNGLKHGMVGTRTYALWESMLRRIRNDEEYISKGIGLETPGWEDFPTFRRDMGDVPDDKESIDRIDNTRGYGWIPGPDGKPILNCRYADRIQQNNNTCANVRITVGGVSMTVAEAARAYDVCPNALGRRVNEGQDHDEAVQVLVTDRNRERLSEIAQREGVSYRALWKRIWRGASLPDALKALKSKKGKPTMIHEINAAGVSISAVKHRIRNCGMTLEQAIRDALAYKKKHADGAII
ncbi:MAG: hypothetical protein K2X00_09855 [Nitrospiraceae bacterium]|nr:hypothetical protein [Nitrospiraceae bacterium]